MKMLRWMSGQTWHDRIRDTIFGDNIVVLLKNWESRLGGLGMCGEDPQRHLQGGLTMWKRVQQLGIEVDLEELYDETLRGILR